MQSPCGNDAPTKLRGVSSDALARYTIELTLFCRHRNIERRDDETLKSNLERGLHGLALQIADRITLFSSNKWLTHNYGHHALLERLSESAGGPRDAYRNPQNALVRFDTCSFVTTSTTNVTERLFRGDRTIDVAEVAIPGIQTALDQMGQWLLNCLRSDGRLEYKYFPSRGSYSTANNMIRQWMATHAFAELFNFTGDDRYADAWRRNVNYNLRNYFVRSQGIGYIFYNNKAKLGAAACALLALLRGPDRCRFSNVIGLLKKCIMQLYQQDGSFRTFLIPAWRNDNQNFYSGEALLALAHCLASDWDQPLSALIEKSRGYYMPFHRAQGRNTAFVPWHTMAYWQMTRLTDDSEYRKAIYELNDWLICVQNLDDNSAPDTLGRFYVERFRQNGPPHASSTGVYVEGLAHAFDLARRDACSLRADAYLHAIRYGLRSLLQLQYREENAFYIRKKNCVLGGVRTTVEDNVLRCDNTQHAIMALLAVLRLVPRREFLKETVGASRFREAALQKYGAAQP